MLTKHWMKFISVILSLVYGITIIFGICRFEYDKNTGKMRKNKFLVVYSTIFSSILSVSVPIFTTLYYLNFSEFTESFGQSLIEQTRFLDTSTVYLNQVAIFYCIYVNNDDLIGITNTALNLLSIVRRHSGKMKVDHKKILMILLKLVMSVGGFIGPLISTIRDYDKNLMIVELLYKIFFCIAAFVCASFKCVKCCAYLYAGSLLDILNSELEIFLKSDQKKMEKIQRILKNYRKTLLMINTISRIFSLETLANQLSLYVMIACDVRIPLIINITSIEHLIFSFLMISPISHLYRMNSPIWWYICSTQSALGWLI